VMPGRTCNICSHPYRDAIERDILHRVSQERIATAHATQNHPLSQSGVSRHAENCIPELLAKAREADDVARADVLLADLGRIRAAAFRALEDAEGAGDRLTMLRAIREARENLRILGELRGELNAAQAQRALISPVALQVIIQTLEPHPELAEAVAEALEPLEELEAPVS
jgi:hypothetical protein